MSWCKRIPELVERAALASSRAGLKHFKWETKPPASSLLISQYSQRLDFQFPPTFIEFLQYSNGAGLFGTLGPIEIISLEGLTEAKAFFDEGFGEVSNFYPFAHFFDGNYLVFNSHVKYGDEYQILDADHEDLRVTSITEAHVASSFEEFVLTMLESTAFRREDPFYWSRREWRW